LYIPPYCPIINYRHTTIHTHDLAVTHADIMNHNPLIRHTLSGHETRTNLTNIYHVLYKSQ